MRTGLGAIHETAFVERRQREWAELEGLLARAAQRRISSLAPEEIARISPLYRDTCADLARAQAARYGASLLEYLHGLTASAHGLLYAAPPRASVDLRARVRTWVARFPRVFRAHKGAMGLAFVLFFAPMFAGLVATILHPDFAFRVAPESMLRPLTEAYAKGFSGGRDSSEGALMAGFYVNNNVGIALRCFAVGIFGGVGSAFYLVQNGLATGAILGYVASQGAGANIVTFIGAGHSAFELSAIVIAGGAGLMLGWSFIVPGARTRRAALEAAGRDAVVLVSGAAVMLFIAAGIEAYWSGSSAPAMVKRGVGLGLFVLVTLFLVLVGRDEEPEAHR
jgi:uncharacterized membrane protein SpoIIM required for sporulation